MRNNVTGEYHNPSKPVPFNTGKVLIGCNYQRKNQYAMSNFEYRLQESMIRRNERAVAAFDLVCWIISALLFVWLFAVVK